MSVSGHVTSTAHNGAELKKTLNAIQSDVAQASSRDDLTKLYRHAEGLLALTYSPSWQKKFGDKVDALRKEAVTGFESTAHAVNARAAQIGTKADFDETWGGPQHVYGTVSNEADLRKIAGEIRDDVMQASSRDELTKLYRRAEYLITLTYAPAWQKKFGDKVGDLRRIAESGFASTARAINDRARQIGTAADYDETWDSGR